MRAFAGFIEAASTYDDLLDHVTRPGSAQAAQDALSDPKTLALVQAERRRQRALGDERLYG